MRDLKQLLGIGLALAVLASGCSRTEEQRSFHDAALANDPALPAPRPVPAASERADVEALAEQMLTTEFLRALEQRPREERREAIASLNDAVLASLEPGILARYESLLFSGCNRAIRLQAEGCHFVELFRSARSSYRVVLAIAALYRGDLEKHQYLLLAAYDLSGNLYSDADLNSAYLGSALVWAQKLRQRSYANPDRVQLLAQHLRRLEYILLPYKWEKAPAGLLAQIKALGMAALLLDGRHPLHSLGESLVEVLSAAAEAGEDIAWLEQELRQTRSPHGLSLENRVAALQAQAPAAFANYEILLKNFSVGPIAAIRSDLFYVLTDGLFGNFISPRLAGMIWRLAAVAAKESYAQEAQRIMEGYLAHAMLLAAADTNVEWATTMRRLVEDEISTNFLLSAQALLQRLRERQWTPFEEGASRLLLLLKQELPEQDFAADKSANGQSVGRLYRYFRSLTLNARQLTSGAHIWPMIVLLESRGLKLGHTTKLASDGALGEADDSSDLVVSEFLNSGFAPDFDLFSGAIHYYNQTEAIYLYDYALKLGLFNLYGMDPEKHFQQIAESYLVPSVRRLVAAREKISGYLQANEGLNHFLGICARTAQSHCSAYPGSAEVCAELPHLRDYSQQGSAFPLDYTQLDRATVAGMPGAGAAVSQATPIYHASKLFFFPFPDQDGGVGVLDDAIDMVRYDIEPRQRVLTLMREVVAKHLEREGEGERAQALRAATAYRVGNTELDALIRSHYSSLLEAEELYGSCLPFLAERERDRRLLVLQFEESHLRNVHREMALLRAEQDKEARQALQTERNSAYVIEGLDGLENLLGYEEYAASPLAHFNDKAYSYSKFIFFLRMKSYLEQGAAGAEPLDPYNEIQIKLPDSTSSLEISFNQGNYPLRWNEDPEEFVQAGINHLLMKFLGQRWGRIEETLPRFTMARARFLTQLMKGRQFAVTERMRSRLLGPRGDQSPLLQPCRGAEQDKGCVEVRPESLVRRALEQASLFQIRPEEARYLELMGVQSNLRQPAEAEKLYYKFTRYDGMLKTTDEYDSTRSHFDYYLDLMLLNRYTYDTSQAEVGTGSYANKYQRADYWALLRDFKEYCQRQTLRAFPTLPTLEAEVYGLYFRRLQADGANRDDFLSAIRASEASDRARGAHLPVYLNTDVGPEQRPYVSV